MKCPGPVPGTTSLRGVSLRPYVSGVTSGSQTHLGDPCRQDCVFSCNGGDWDTCPRNLHEITTSYSPLPGQRNATTRLIYVRDESTF